MEEEYYLYNGKIFSTATLIEKWGDSYLEKVSEHGLEKAFSYNGKVFASSTLQEKYGDDYENIASQKGILPYAPEQQAEAAAPPAVPFGQGSSEPSDQQEQPSGSTTEVLDPTKPLYEQGMLGSETRQFTNPVLEDKVAKQKPIPKELIEQSMLPEDVVSKSDSLFNQEDLDTKINSIKLAEEQGTHRLFYHTEDLRPVAMDGDQVKGLITSKVIELYQSERVDKPDFNELKEDEKKVVLQSLFSEFVPGDAIEDYMESNGFERSSNQFIGFLKTSKSNFLKGVATMASSSLASGEALSDYAYQGGQQSDVTALKHTVLAAKGGLLTKKEFEKKMEYLREDKKSAPTVLEYVNTREGQMAQPRPMTDAEKAEYDRLFSITYEQAQKEQVDIQQTPSTSIDEWAAKQKVDPEWMDNFVARDLSNAAGSVAAFAGFGLLSGGAAAPTMAFGASVAFGSAYKEAMQSGSPDAGWAGIMASPSGIVDGLAATKFFKSVGKAVDGVSDKTLWRMATTGATEGLTETGQGIWENITAKTIYDDTREVFTEETLREGGAGFVLGVLGVGGAASLRAGARKMFESSDQAVSDWGGKLLAWMNQGRTVEVGQRLNEIAKELKDSEDPDIEKTLTSTEVAKLEKEKSELLKEYDELDKVQSKVDQKRIGKIEKTLNDALDGDGMSTLKEDEENALKKELKDLQKKEVIRGLRTKPGDGPADSVDIYANEALNDQEANRVRELQNILKDEGGVLAEEEKETLQAELDGYLERVKNTQQTSETETTEQSVEEIHGKLDVLEEKFLQQGKTRDESWRLALESISEEERQTLRDAYARSSEDTELVEDDAKDKGADTELQEVEETGEPEVQDTEGDRLAEGQSRGIVDKTLKAVIAPFRKTQVKDSKEASAATGTKEYTEHKSRLQSVAKELGIEGELTMQDNMGGFASQEGNGVVKEVSTTVYFPDGTTKEQADEFAAIMGSMTVEAQEATISSQEVATGQEANSIEYSVETKDPDALVAALEAEGITDYSVDLATGTVAFLDLDLDKETKESKQKTIETLERVAEAAGIEADWMGVFTNSTYIDGKRKTEILEKIKSKNGRSSSGKNVGALSEEAARIEKDRSERARAKELGTTITKLIKEIREYVSENWKMFQDNNKFLEKLEFEPLLENTENPTTLNKNVGILSKALLGTRLPKQLQDLFGDKISEARKMIKEYAAVQKVGKKKANADFFFKMLEVAERREKKGISGAKEKALRDLAATFASVVESMEDAGVTVVTDLKAYKDATGKDGQSSTRQGIFVSKEGTIYLNVEELADGWGKTVIFHEATHPIINIIKNTDKKLYDQVIAGIQSLKKDPALKKQIEAIEAQVAKSDVYKSKAERADEVLVEFIALVASGDVTLPEGRKGLMKVFEDFMIKIAKMLGLDYKSDKSLINLASMISETLKSGSSIESIVGKGNVTKENMTVKDQSSAIDRESDGSVRGLPRTFKINGKEMRASAFPKAIEVANKYMEKAGIPYNPPSTYAKVDKERAKRIADEYDKTKHDPTNPKVKAFFKELADQSNAQYQALMDSGLKVEMMKPGQKDPYGGNPRQMTEDVRKNNHMWVYPSDAGYGPYVYSSKANFTKALEAARAAMPIKERGSVSSLPKDFDGRVFLHNSGKAGFGIAADGELVAAFKTSDGPAGVAKNALEIGKGLGATHLWAFDGKLTGLYSKHGASETERMKWNDDYAPEGWDKKTMGTPDVVRMSIENVEAPPALDGSGFKASGRELTNQEVFRAVHDYFGHVKEGFGFRANGEENAWRSHMAMFTEGAQRALTTLTRGQNSWVNYGPYGETNRTASSDETKYAEQKIGIMPKWVSEEGRADSSSSQSSAIDRGEKGAWKSTAQEGLGKISLSKATPDAWMKQISEKGGKGTVQELEWLGTMEFMIKWMSENKAKSVPKEVVQKYLQDNQLEIVEVSKGSVGNFNSRFGNLVPSEIERKIDYIKNNKPNLTIEKNRKGTWNIYDRTNSPIPILKEVGSESVAKDIISNPSKYEKSEPTKYSQYQLEGGENYREVLLTMPKKKIALSKEQNEDFTRLLEKSTKDIFSLTDKEMARLDSYKEIENENNRDVGYQSSHWDEANILAHVRMNERTLPNGERVLFMEEVQSDWAQQGKKKGFGDRGGVPNMPYKKTDQWVGMAFRRFLQMAAQTGMDRVAWVTGEQSADRYDLSKQVDEINWSNQISTGNAIVEIKMPTNKLKYSVDRSTGVIGDTLLGDDFTGKSLEDVIGKDLANKIVSEKYGTLQGEGLKVGGEGMKAFYNSILPKVAKKEAQRIDKKADVEAVDFRESVALDPKLFSVIEINTPKELLDISNGPKMYEVVYDGKPVKDVINDNTKGEIRWIHQHFDPSVVRSDTKDGADKIRRKFEKSIQRTNKADKAGEQLSIPITDKMKEVLSGPVPQFSAIDRGEKLDPVKEKTIKKSPLFIRRALDFAKASAFKNQYEFKSALQAHYDKYKSEIIKAYGGNFDPEDLTDPKTIEYFSDFLSEEALEAIKDYPEALGWYEAKVYEALSVLGIIHPEINTDLGARTAFTAALAITSNGNLVDKNFDLAEKQYEFFKQNGRFDETMAAGSQGAAVKSSLGLINDMLDEGITLEMLNDFMISEWKVGDLYYKNPKDNKKVGLIGNELVNEVVYGAAIFGPKVGNGFFMNLSGFFEQLTMDRWFMRMFGRVNGTLLERSPQFNDLIKTQKQRLKEAYKATMKDPAARAIMKRHIKNPSKLGILNLAAQINKVSLDPELRKELTSNPLTDELRRAGVNLNKKWQGHKEAPKTGNERIQIRAIFKEIQRKLLERHGIDISMADLQAALWYPEKLGLYQSFKAEKAEKPKKKKASKEAVEEVLEEEETSVEDAPPPDYSQAAQKLVAEKGIPKNKIDDAVRRRTAPSLIDLDKRGEEGFSEADRNANKEQVAEALRGAKVKSKSQASAIDRNSVVYHAAMVDDQAALKKKFPPVHPNEFYHHSTMEFKPKETDDIRLGEKSEMKVTGRLTTDKVDVILVDNPRSKNADPHITLSTAEGVKPFESNKEIEANRDQIKPVKDFSISVTEGYFDGKSDVKTTQSSAIDRGEKRLAPNGKPSNLNETQYNQVRTPEFKRWFGDWENDPTNASKVVDENGEPLAVYHGSRGFYDGKNKQLEGKDITQFSSERLIFTTDNIDVAKYFGDFKQYFVNIKKPFIIDDGYNLWERLDEDYLIKKIGKQKFIEIINQEYGESFTYDEWLKYVNEVEALPISIDVVSVYIKENKYYDGVIAFDIQETTNHIESNDFICFNPNEIKLADGTNTTFDPNDNRIQFSAIDRGQKNSRISERMNAINSQFKNTKYNAVQQDMVAELAAEALDEMGEIAGFEYARDQLTGEGELALRADMMMRAIARLTDKQLEGKATATEKRKIAEMHALFSLENTEKGGALAQLNKVYTDYPLLKRWNEIYRVTEGFREGMEKRYSPDSETDTRTNEEVIRETEEALRKEFETTLRNEVEKAVREALNKRDSGTTSTKSTNDQKKKAARARIKKEVDNLKGLLRKLGGTANMGLPVEDTANILSAMTRVVRAYINAGIVNASAIISELRSEIGDTMTDQDLKDTVNYIINKEKLRSVEADDVNTLKEEFYKVLKDNETISKEDVRRIAAMVGMNPDYVRMAAENAQADYDLTISTDPASRPRTKGPKDAAREKKARARRAADTVTESVSIKAAIDQVMDDIRDGVTPDTKAIAKNIVDTMNLSPRLAIKIAEQIEKKLNERIDKVLETTLKVEPRPDEDTIKRRQEQSKLINKVRRAIASGALSNGEGVIDAFQEKFGLEPIAARDAVLLETLSDEIAKLEKEARDNPESLRREQLAHLYKEMNGAIDRIKKKNPAWYGRWFMSIGVKNTLSGVNTPKNAGLGGLMQLSWMNTMVTLSELVKGGRIPSNAVRILKSGIKALKMVPSAFSGAVQAMKSGVAAHSSMDTIFEGALQDYETRSERAFSAGFKEAWKQTRSKEDVWALGRYTYEVITIGTRLLVAMDAFMAPVSAEYISELNERAKRSTAQNPSLQLPEISDFKDQAKRDLENVRKSIRSIASKLNPIDSSMNQSQVKAVLKAREKEVSIREKKMGVTTSDEGSYIRRRSAELYQNSKKESFIEALGLVKEYLLLGEPRGIGGLATSGIQKAISIKDSDGWGAVALKVPLGLSFLFMRMLGNMINMTIEGSLFAPITNTLSLKRGVDGSLGITSAMKENPMRARAKWMSSLVAYGTMLYLFGQVFKIGDEDDGEDEGKIMLNPDRKYDFYGAGDKDKGQIGGRPRMQVVNRETGEAYEIKYLPNIMPALAAIGIMQDIVAQRGRSEEDGATKAKKDFEDRSTVENVTLAAAEGFWKSLGEGSFNSINRIQMSWSKGANASESFVSVLTDITLGSLNKGISPAIIRDTKLQIETLINEVEGEDNIEKAPDYLTPSRDGFGDVFVNTLLRGTLLEDSFTEAGLGGREKLDAIGNPIQETPPSMRLLGRRVYDSKELSELAEKYGPELVLKNYKLTTNKDVRNNNKKQDGLIRFADTEEGRDDMIQFEIAVKKKAWEITKPQIKDEFSKSLEDYKKQKEEAIESMNILPEEITVMGITATPRKDAIESVKAKYPELTEEQWMARQGDALSERWKENLKKAQSDLVKEITDKAAAEGYKPRDKRAGTKLIAF